MKFTSRLAKLVGVASLAALLATGLAACGTPAGMNEDFLVQANVKDLDCTVESSSTATAELQETANFVADASPKQTADILALNKGLTSLEPLTAALNAKIADCGGTNATLASESDTTALSPELKALLDAANAPLDQYVCATVVTNTQGSVIDGAYTQFVNTILAVDEGNLNLRQWSDALSTPLKGKTPEEMRTWLERAICEDIPVGISLAHLFAHLKVGDVSILSLQSTDWLEFANVDASKVNDLIAQYAPLTVWRLEHPGKQDIPMDVYQAAITANHEYQEIASRLLFLLSRYQLATQVTSIDSTHHYHLVGGGLTADDIPEVEIDSRVDNRPALVFYLTEKVACKPLSVLGFNTGDKRPMLGSIPETCETFVPPVVTPPTECKKDCGSTPPPPPSGCKTNCSPPPPCTTDCAKDQSKNVTPPNGVTPQGPVELKPRPSQPDKPAPVNPDNKTPESNQTSPGTTTPEKPRETPPPATGNDGGSVNPPDTGTGTPPANEETITNPFG